VSGVLSLCVCVCVCVCVSVADDAKDIRWMALPELRTSHLIVYLFFLLSTRREGGRERDLENGELNWG